MLCYLRGITAAHRDKRPVQTEDVVLSPRLHHKTTHVLSKNERTRSRIERAAWAALLAAPVHHTELAGNHGMSSHENHSLLTAPHG